MNFLKEDSKKLVKGKTGKVYLIDSENINDVWVNLLDRMEEHDKIIVFYTDKSAHMSYEKIIRLLERDKGSLTWVKCFEGQNALDFQLVSVLGAMIVKSSKREYVIVADDCGYDAAVKYWRRCKGKVSRMKSSECAKIARQAASGEESTPFDFLKNTEESEASAKDKREKDEVRPVKGPAKEKKRKNGTKPVRGEETCPEPETVKTEMGKQGTGKTETRGTEAGGAKTGGTEADKTEAEKTELDKAETKKAEAEAAAELPEEAIEFLRRLSVSVNSKNKSLYHNALINLLGQDTGNQIYRALTEDKELRHSAHAQLLPSKKERISSYLELILEKEGIGTADLDKIVSLFLQNPRTNLQFLNIGLVKKFGAEKGGIYYRIIKKHIKVLQRL